MLRIFAAPDPNQFIALDSLMEGQKFFHYSVLRKLGEGGMGVVYLARDARLDREVALKFLPPAVGSDDLSRDRFLKEARLAAGLSHPSICTVYEAGIEEGKHFIAMEFVAGDTVADRIRRGDLPASDAIQIAKQVLKGLESAHEQRIVHRDIKPANLMIDAHGQVKIMDFGLARLIDDAGVTRTDATVGTISYMSPEQTRGEEVDGRSDLWSTGVVLYEMLTGKVPFSGAYQYAVMYALLNMDPEPVTVLRGSLPDDLDGILQKALSKRSYERYQTAGEFRAALESVSTEEVSGSHEIIVSTEIPVTAEVSPFEADDYQSIVVLPFRNISPDGENEYFSDGLTEEIISDLTQIRSLSVISRTSAMMLKGTDKNIREIGKELDVHYALEGSVRKAGDRVRITAHLVDTTNDRQLWTDKYTGTLEDIFDLQEAVSRSIVDALKIKLSRSEEVKLAARPFENVAAFDAYLRARQEIFRFSAESLDAALEHLNRGKEIAGAHPLLDAGIGYVHWQAVNAGIKPGEHLDLAESAAKSVVAADPHSPHGHRLLGLIELLRGNPVECMKHLTLAVAIQPDDPDALIWLIPTYGLYGLVEEAIPFSERLMKIDPLTPLTYGMAAFIHLLRGDFDDAMRLNRRMYDMEPDNPLYAWLFVQSLAYAGATDEAVRVSDSLSESSPEHVFSGLCSIFTAALTGRNDEARAALTENISGFARGDLQNSWFMADCFALMEDREGALDWLENAVSLGFMNGHFLSTVDPYLASLRENDRFMKLMHSIDEKKSALTPAH